MAISAHILQQAIDLYLKIAYPSGAIPAAVSGRAEGVRALAPGAEVGEELLERDAADAVPRFALRLGQPMYPNMKLVIESEPCVAGRHTGSGYLLRVDTHDQHLHAAEGSPDAAWLASIRASNKELTERIEAAWAHAGLPTFKNFLRQQLDARKAKNGTTDARG